MDEQSISLGKGLQLFDDGNPTPAGLAAVFVGIMVFLVAFKFAGESLEQPLESTEVTLEVSYIHPDDPNSRVEGEIIIQLYPSEAPKHVENFLYLVDNGMYDLTIFHRVIDGFMIQGGGLTSDMNNKSSGTAPIQNEANNGLSNDRGTIAMARTMDPHSATGQFFINHKDNGFLNHTGENSQGWGYAVFGAVTEGMDVVDQIADVPTGSSGGHQDVPVDAITIESVTISE